MERLCSLVECIFGLCSKSLSSCEEYGSVRRCTRPTISWVLRNLHNLLLSYPGGITLCVLLTDLQSRWRSQLGIGMGDESDRLALLAASGRCGPSDVLCGVLHRLDDSRASIAYVEYLRAKISYSLYPRFGVRGRSVILYPLLPVL